MATAAAVIQSYPALACIGLSALGRPLLSNVTKSIKAICLRAPDRYCLPDVWRACLIYHLMIIRIVFAHVPLKRPSNRRALEVQCCEILLHNDERLPRTSVNFKG